MVLKTGIDKGGSANADEETLAMIYEGLNQSQICKLFGLDPRTVREKLFKGGVKPCGRRYNAEIYAFKDIAGHLVKPHFDIEEYIRRMEHHELPQKLTKEFWAGQRIKQQVEEEAGNLWSTEKVIQEVGELYKIFKMSTLLINDAVERNTDLSDRQRQVIQSLTAGMLIECQQLIKEHFKPNVQRKEIPLNDV